MTNIKYLYLTAIITALVITGCTTTKKDNGSVQTAQTNSNGRNDAWGFAGYGGGGAMFHPAVSPFNPDYAFVACDMTGTFVTHNGGDSWRMFSLRGPVDFFVFDPSDSNTIYANSIALFKSTDRGNTWNLFYPSAKDVKGVVSKGDHASEVVITNDSTNRRVECFAVDPSDSKKLYAVISINKMSAFYTSMDGGLNWTEEKKLDGAASGIFIHPGSPQNNRTIYIAAKKYMLSKENAVWKNNALPGDIGMLTQFTGGFDKAKNAFVVYAISGKSYFDAAGSESGIFYTDDGGKTWENRQTGLLSFNKGSTELPEWRCISTSALHPEVVYVSYNNLSVHADTTCIGVAKSEDYGNTWVLSWKDNLTKKGNIPSANFTDGWLNDRFGPTWGENPFSMGVSPVNADVCYATDFGRTIKTTDGGKTWQQAYSKKKNGQGWMSRGLEVTTSYSIVFDPFDTSHVYITNTDVGLMESHDGGESWKSATQDNGVPREWINSAYWLTFDPEVKGRAWVVMSNTHDLPRPKMWRKNGVKDYKGGILVTENSGKTWQVTSGDVEAAMTHILMDPAGTKDARILYAAAFGRGVYKSIDAGKTWQLKNNGIEATEPFAWRLVKEKKGGRLYLIVSRRGEDGSMGSDKDGAVYYSEDGAENWKKLQLPAETNAPTSLAVDPVNPDRLILSAWGRNVQDNFSPDIGGGIYVSDDHGKNWKAVLQKDQHVHDITYDSRSNLYYACGFNSSAYRSADNGETWQRIKGYNFKWGKRVDLDPRHPDKIFVITFGGGVWYGPAAGDEKAVEDIITPVLSFK